MPVFGLPSSSLAASLLVMVWSHLERQKVNFPWWWWGYGWIACVGEYSAITGAVQRGEFINRSINTTIQNSTGKENAPVNRFCQSESLEKEFRKIIVTGEKRNRNLKYLFSKLCW